MRPFLNNSLHGILFLFLISLIACESQNDAQIVEGILYSDDKPIRIEIHQGKINKITRPASIGENSKMYVAPGLIDIQINGFKGVDFSDQELTPDMMRNATEGLWKEGVTTYLPTVITRDHERLERSFSLLSEVFSDTMIRGSIPGFHLEGPYISPVKGFRGAHNEKYIRNPDLGELAQLQEAAGGRIRLITVAPEIEGAIPFIEKCNEQGMVISLAHHNASSEKIEEAVRAGASFSTHLGNGCANEIHRHNNPLWPQLSNDGLSITIIADGAHLTRDEVRTFYKVKGPEKTILVSDALALAGLPLGEYVVDGDTLLLTEDVVKFPAENVLAGAAKPINKCVGVMMRFTDCSLGEAINMASTNPARLMNLEDRGEIVTGKRADLILFSLQNDNIVIEKTLVAGEVVFTKE
ncbi:N-acetylglucosamine-6-phosphate deacetylase [Bacteroidota bacterium]